MKTKQRGVDGTTRKANEAKKAISEGRENEPDPEGLGDGA